MLTPNQQNIELGKVKFGKDYNFYYIITNTYPEHVTLVRLAVGCSSCTTASCDKNVLLPGETAKVNVKFTPGSLGIASKYVDIQHLVGEKSEVLSTRVTFKGVVS